MAQTGVKDYIKNFHQTFTFKTAEHTKDADDLNFRFFAQKQAPNGANVDFIGIERQ